MLLHLIHSRHRLEEPWHLHRQVEPLVGLGVLLLENKGNDVELCNFLYLHCERDSIQKSSKTCNTFCITPHDLKLLFKK